jgi:hypothetical protein
VTVRDPKSEVEFAAFLPCSASPALEAVPESNDELFEELFHNVLQCGGTRDKNGNNVPGLGRKNMRSTAVPGSSLGKRWCGMIYGVKFVMNTSPYLRPDFFWAVYGVSTRFI